MWPPIRSAADHCDARCRFFRPATRALVAKAIMIESRRSPKKFGVNPRRPSRRRIEGARKVGAHKTSMLKDLERGRTRWKSSRGCRGSGNGQPSPGPRSRRSMRARARRSAGPKVAGLAASRLRGTKAPALPIASAGLTRTFRANARHHVSNATRAPTDARFRRKW